MSERLLVAASPHVHGRANTRRAMWVVVLALVPSGLFSLYLFGWRALLLIALSIAAAAGSEALSQRLLGRPVTLKDGSALLTGLLLAYNLPPGVPWWMPVLGSVFGIVVAKQLFGGLGHNFVNPALAGRAFLMASWPTQMTKAWLTPAAGTVSGIAAVSGATPLGLLKNPANYGDPAQIMAQLNQGSTVRNLFLGNVGGSLGETSALLLLAAGLFLMVMRVVDYRIVIGYLGSFTLLALALPAGANIWVQLFAGGLFLGAFFMATDWVTSPVSKRGRWIFGVGCGLLTYAIRRWGGYPEGVCYAILIMNVFTPVIDMLTREKVFGSRKESRK